MYDKDSLTNHKTYLVDSLSKIILSLEVDLLFLDKQFHIKVNSCGKNICNIGIKKDKVDWSTWAPAFYGNFKTIENLCMKWLKDVEADRYRRDKCADFANLIRLELLEKQNLP